MRHFICLAIGVWVYGCLGMVGEVRAQSSRYTIDDVMDRLMEMDKNTEVRFARLEAKVEQNKERINEVRSSLSTTIWSLFGFLLLIQLAILGFIYNLAQGTKRAELSENFASALEALQKQVNQIMERERKLEERLQAASLV